MRPRQDPTDALLGLARAQSGMLHSGQVGQLGLGRHPVARLTASGHWQRLERGLFFLGPDQPGWLGWAWGGVLLGGPESRLAGQAAAHLHGLAAAPEQLEVLVPHARTMADRPPWQFRRERSGVREARSPGTPPRTTVEDTVLDLVNSASREQAVGWVTAAVQNRRTTVPRLRRALLGRSRLRHRELLADLLADVAAGAETPLELAYLREVEQPHGLPRGERQLPSRTAPHRRDVVYPQYATVVELDGRLGHEGMGRFRDMRRDNSAAVNGEATLRYGWPDVTGQSCQVAFQVAAVLSRRGWLDLPTRCPRCRLVTDDIVG